MQDNKEVQRIRSVYLKWESTIDETDLGRRLSLNERNLALRHMLDLHFKRPLPECRILDLGCGFGHLLDWFYKQDASADRLVGVDLLPYRIKAAREMYPAYTFVEGNAEHLDYTNGSFDLVVAFTVFSSVLDDSMARHVAREIRRVLAPTGAVAWYDMRYPNPFNRNTRPMTRRRIANVFSEFEIISLEAISLLPPLARRLGGLSETAYPYLAAIPILRSHYMGLFKPTADHGT